MQKSTLLATVAICGLVAFTPVVADDSAALLALRSQPAVSQDALAHEQQLQARHDYLKTTLKAGGLSKAEKKQMKADLKVVKKELKAVKKANKKAQKAYDKRLASLTKNLRKQYGMGPYPAEISNFVADKPEVLKPFYSSLFIEGERNATLNLNRLGLAAMEAGYYGHAEWAFDRAIDKIEAIYADNPQAKAAKSKFKEESVKDFKGEPYERAMAYYYRGLLYLRIGDYENARAVFRAGEYQDSVSDLEEFQADFAVLNYLDGWALQCQGRSGEEPFRRANEVRPNLAAPAPENNTLMISELGAGPQKIGEGKYNEILKFEKDERFGETNARFIVENRTGATTEFTNEIASSVYWQSSTRGGRPIDGLLEGKASFKETTDAIGDGLATVGTGVALAGLASGDSDAALIGAGVAIIGGIFSAVSASSKPQADTRMWDNLPDLVTVSTGAFRSVGEYRYSTVYSGPHGDIASPSEVYMMGAGDTCGIIWTRSRSALNVPESSPGARMTWKKMRKQKKRVQQKDMNFRNWLLVEAPIDTLQAELR
ncbi:hypothetical protein [Kordiimonas laminariae]|uniref:hypothetical protein n=1 Tax=Kordiimonas laminariae TaxID=2917717 RepID=UPI001FF3DFEB|nr:hypothetical protein [Kordiimonas laminariae]MCK0068178.1 hypothetical protein [Kordiimonas laminariae]